MSFETNDPLIGTTIANGKYRIQKVLGEGGMGKVYQGVQKLGDLDRLVAIKTLQPELAADEGLVKRFLREAGTVGMLEHPNTIKFYESGKLDDGKLFVAMEFVPGDSLAHLIAAGPMPPQRVEHILAQVCGSLGEAHENGIIHRDLKPENIKVIQKNNKGDFVKVLDFGIAKRDESAEDIQQAKLTRQGMVLGTPPYMSPEQFTGQKLKGTSDIYSLAIVAYEMLTGQLPFTASTPWEWATKHLTAPPQPFEHHPVNAQLLPRHKQAVMRALAKKPEDRPQTTLQFLQEFTGNAAGAAEWAAGSTSGAGGFGQPSAPNPYGPGSAPNPYGQPSAPNAFGQQSAPNPYGSMQGGAAGAFTPQPIGGATSPAGSGGVPATMAVPNYPTPTPQPFQQATPQPFPQSAPNPFQAPAGFGPAPSNPGFPAVQNPASNPAFNPVQPNQGYGYSSQGNYAAMPQPVKPQGGGAGKFIAIGIAVLLLGGVGVAVAMSGGDSNNRRNNNGGDNNTANNNVNNNGQAPNNNGYNAGVNNGGMQPVNNGGMQPVNNGGMQPVNNGGMQPIPTPPPTLQPIPTPPPNPQPRPVVPSVPSVCRGGASRIDDLILSGRCSAAQSLYRAMRAAGCAPRGADQSFGSACQHP
ncbi:MAG: protein kinase [Polyangiales bacterium]